ncbi:hypothetical protein TcG_07539 [Trypanosoma cruzi]|nr:hypothetical protein TcG_07539 [Trypanosoma cruzi]
MKPHTEDVFFALGAKKKSPTLNPLVSARQCSSTTVPLAPVLAAACPFFRRRACASDRPPRGRSDTDDVVGTSPFLLCQELGGRGFGWAALRGRTATNKKQTTGGYRWCGPDAPQQKREKPHTEMPPPPAGSATRHRSEDWSETRHTDRASATDRAAQAEAVSPQFPHGFGQTNTPRQCRSRRPRQRRPLKALAATNGRVMPGDWLLTSGSGARTVRKTRQKKHGQDARAPCAQNTVTESAKA